MQHVNWTALIIFVALFGFITWLGFAAAHWRKGDLDLLHEWGLGGRRFGTIITWFLVGGDLYTAYTFIAVPALAFGAGACGNARCLEGPSTVRRMPVAARRRAISPHHSLTRGMPFDR